MSEPRILWQPDSATVARSRMAAFREWLASHRGVVVADYDELWRWSVADLEGFWGAFAEFAGVRFHAMPQRVLTDESMPGARWFPGATLNYAEHALAPGPGKGDDDLAVIFRREDGYRDQLSFGLLRQRVAAGRAALASLGVRRGTGWSRWRRTRRTPWWPSSPRPAWARSGRPARRTSGPERLPTGSFNSPPPC